MRFRVIISIYFVVVVLVILRLFYWQVISNEDLTARAENQRVSSKDVIAPRGDILFSDGSVLASNQPNYLVFAQPKVIEDKLRVASILGEIFAEREYSREWTDELKKLTTIKELEDFNNRKKLAIKEIEEEILKRISSDLYWVSLARSVNLEEKQKIEKHGFKGIGFEQKWARYYPEGSSSAHLLGFIGSDKYGFDKGYFGLEGFYDGELRGKKGVVTEEKDAHGLPILIGKYQSKEPDEGKTLVLHIDRTMQMILEEKLKQGIEKYQAKSVSAIVLDPKTGGVLAMASYPNYDPGDVLDFPKEFFKNPITVDGYEPGSTFKVVVMAAGINEGLVTADTRCDICSGPLSIGGFTIRTWNNKYYGDPTLTDVIVHSDNTGMVFVAKKLGLEKLYKYIEDFGFGRSTNVDLEDESSPYLRPMEEWREIDLATASFGQGISVNALQVVRAVGAIANGGRLMEPHVVKTVKDRNGEYPIEPRELRRPITKETAEKVKEMMVRAVEDGEAKFTSLKGYRVAGKTGTAQIPVAGHYDSTKTIASFVGFAPADDPKFVMLVRYEQPTKSIYGSETAAPTFFQIAKEYFTYLGIPPGS